MKKKVIIIAEAGVNHNGDIKLAEKLIDKAAEAGVDYVKFQTFKANKIVVKSLSKAEYQKNNTGNSDSQYKMLKKLELSEKDHDQLKGYAKTKKISFFSTAFDVEGVSYLKSLGFEHAKIPSGEITNLPYLRAIAQNFDKIILSTGMADLSEINDAFQALLANGTKKENITILHCTTDYPTAMQDVNLKAMLHIQNEFGVDVGYSDHTLGIEVPIAAVALGATVIEKHFTLDRNMDGPDHAASLEPNELKEMVKAIRNVEVAIAGSGIKEPAQSELKNRAVARKCIVAFKAIKKGELFSEQNLTVKRSGSGISPMKWDEVIGKSATKDFNTDELISL
jgi:N,N'-diacetyllegionaminate synthase